MGDLFSQFHHHRFERNAKLTNKEMDAKQTEYFYSAKFIALRST